MPKKRFGSPRKKCEIVNSEKIVRFKFKNKMYTYRYESSPSHGFGYILDCGKKIYGPYPHERTPEGVEVFEAFWKEHLQNEAMSDHALDPKRKLREEVVVM